ncbi:hypothetical protein OHT61_09710 [Streptomyces sp. NBC_00178]|uniref:hypothetical protein n=1 Tax=Streptomyces sp. NBC_00178 TaxID=2975672 RepID=UPI002E29EC65|nr:hypothetical protein [Streptomyces sp. NBC_00178]
MRTRGTAAAAAAVAGFMTMTGCGLVGHDEAAPAASPVPLVPYTRESAATEIASLARAGGLPDGDTSTAGLPTGDYRSCVAPWLGEAPAAGAAGAFDATVTRLRQHDWEIVSSHAEKDVTYRTLAKRGWKLFARHYTMKGFGPDQIVSLTAVEDGCELPRQIRGDYEDPA